LEIPQPRSSDYRLFRPSISINSKRGRRWIGELDGIESWWDDWFPGLDDDTEVASREDWEEFEIGLGCAMIYELFWVIEVDDGYYEYY